jgi:hypothetical protein
MLANTDLKEGIQLCSQCNGPILVTRLFILQCIDPIGNNNNEDIHANRSRNLAQKGYKNFIILVQIVTLIFTNLQLSLH